MILIHSKIMARTLYLINSYLTMLILESNSLKSLKSKMNELESKIFQNGSMGEKNGENFDMLLNLALGTLGTPYLSLGCRLCRCEAVTHESVT